MVKITNKQNGLQYYKFFIDKHKINLSLKPLNENKLTIQIQYKFHEALTPLILDLNMRKTFYWYESFIQFIANYVIPLELDFTMTSTRDTSNNSNNFIFNWNTLINDKQSDIFQWKPRIDIEYNIKSFVNEYDWIRNENFNKKMEV